MVSLLSVEKNMLPMVGQAVVMAVMAVMLSSW